MRKIYGFTLVELLIVVSIIGILAAAITLSIGNQQRAARDSRRKVDMKAMKTALDKEEFDTSALSVGGGAITRQATTTNNGLALWNTFIPQAYLATVPLDPANGQFKRTVYSNSSSARASVMKCSYYYFNSNGYSVADDQYAYKLASVMENDWQATARDNGAGTLNVQSYEIYSSPSARNLAAYANGGLVNGACP